MSNIVPEKITKFNVYANGDRLLGIAEITLPPLEFQTTEIKGAGIAGTIDSPGGAMFGSLTGTLNWRVTTEEFMTLAEPHGHELDLYAQQLHWDSGKGEYESKSMHIFMKALTKKLDMGKLSDMESQEASTEHEIYYLKIEIDSVPQIEIDKYNYVYRVQGTDFLEQTRRDLGML